MPRWLSLVPLLSAFMAGAIFAATGGMLVLPVGATVGQPGTVSLAVGLSTDGGTRWQSSAAVQQTVLIRGSITPEATQVGKVADVFVVEAVAGKYSMLTTDGTWQAWSGKLDALKPAQDDITLGATHAVTILNGAVTAQGTHHYYLGLQLAGSITLIYSTSPASFEFTVAADPLSYFETEVFDDIVLAKCALCHVKGGAADNSGLHFIKDAALADENYDVFKQFYDFLPSGYDYVLSKVSGGSGHGGGVQLAVGSGDYQVLAGFLDMLDGSGGAAGGSAQSLFDNVVSQSQVDTLRDAALLLAGRLPTSAEKAAVTTGGDTVLRQALLALMQGPQFHRFLTDGANDRLLLRGNEEFNIADDCTTCFPALNAEYWRLKDKADAGAAADRGALTLFMGQLHHSFIEAPLELIAYVVENNKPYSEILTADYDMLTPVLNPLVGGTATFTSGATGVSEFKPGRMTGYYHRDSGTVVQNVAGAALPKLTTPPKLRVDYPHVGVLNSKSFLSRYPTTATNRNRARARWTYYNFLGIDIEALAQRTTDPVALADTNNPTMNNPACTVCHSVLDPVAGTFQDYSDNGIYKAAVNGTDSLDRFYKSAQTGPGLYKTGDTWYKDMRVPGFEGKTATGNTLDWLAEQIVNDSRFATATVRFWWPSVMGQELLVLPEATEDKDYQARLQAYEAQQTEIATLADRFVQSGLSLKNLLADLVLSPWFRTEALGSGSSSALSSAARSEASLSGEKLLTPEQLGRKTDALTGFNWYAQYDSTTSGELSGLENAYNTYYGGIDGFAIKTRARQLTPLMSNVSAAHALESSCPIVLGDFIRTDAQRLLFGGLSPWVTPLTQQASTQSIAATSDTDFKNYSLAVNLPAGAHSVVLSHLNDACDYGSSPTTCKQDKNLIVASVTITAPNGQSTTLNGSTGKFASCAAVTNTSRLTLYSSCTADYGFTAASAGTYTVTASLAAKQSASDPVLAGLNVESAAGAPATAGAALLKSKLVELHSKLLGQNVSATSAEVLASYDLLVQTWQSRRSGGFSPSLLQKALACDWSSDIGFIGTLGYPGTPLQVSGTRLTYKTSEITTWLTPQAQDPLYMKQSWVTVLTYLLSHYDYLHE